MLPSVELPANPTCPAIIQLSPILLLWATWTWLSKYVLFPITVLDKEPRSIVDPQPISQLSLIITMPMWGYLKFFSFWGKKPNPFFPITQPSRTLTFFFIIVFLRITLEPIVQSSPITTLLSIIEL